ncbi:hypothetical protein BLNAU_11482 [Blattamonas nauphoetae]|uniref:Uncharacterized protein n=1 Tax=Blattamonas nauphoetae TaxID=2049346 RepID=A0ABQ9XMI6_9EUKA|nr:hypothetical protein BLNAU_11482 [Blattamonas nauphoetae]
MTADFGSGMNPIPFGKERPDLEQPISQLHQETPPFSESIHRRSVEEETVGLSAVFPDFSPMSVDKTEQSPAVESERVKNIHDGEPGLYEMAALVEMNAEGDLEDQESSFSMPGGDYDVSDLLTNTGHLPRLQMATSGLGEVTHSPSDIKTKSLLSDLESYDFDSILMFHLSKHSGDFSPGSKQSSEHSHQSGGLGQSDAMSLPMETTRYVGNLGDRLAIGREMMSGSQKVDVRSSMGPLFLSPNGPISEAVTGMQINISPRPLYSQPPSTFLGEPEAGVVHRRSISASAMPSVTMSNPNPNSGGTMGRNGFGRSIDSPRAAPSSLQARFGDRKDTDPVYSLHLPPVDVEPFRLPQGSLETSTPPTRTIVRTHLVGARADSDAEGIGRGEVYAMEGKWRGDEDADRKLRTVVSELSGVMAHTLSDSSLTFCRLNRRFWKLDSLDVIRSDEAAQCNSLTETRNRARKVA